MKFKSIALAAILSAAACHAGVEWKNLNSANHICGPALSPEDLEGKVVLVDEWGLRCGPCRALIPRINELHTLWKSRGLVVIGSHRQNGSKQEVSAVTKKCGASYPVYQGAGMVGEPPGDGGLPYLYVVSSKGKVVYSGRSERAAIEAIVNAITEIPDPDSLVGEVELKHFKSLEKQLVYGQNAESRLSMLRSEAARKSSPRAAEAAALADAIEKARADIGARIKKEAQTAPAKAALKCDKYVRTFPSQSQEFRKWSASLKASREVSALMSLETKYDSLSAKADKARNAAQKRPIASEAAYLAKQASKYKTSQDSAVAAEAASLAEAFESLAK